MDKKQGAPTEKGLPRHAPAAMRVTHTTIQRQLGHHLSSQHPLFDGPFSEEAVARTSANLPEWNSPSVHRPPPPLSTVSPVYSSEMQFQNFFNNSFCSSHRFWTHTPQTPNQPLPPIRALVACQKLHFRLRLWLRLGALWLRICLLQLGLHKCIASSGWWSPGLWTNTKTRTEPLGWTLTKCLIDSSLNFC